MTLYTRSSPRTHAATTARSQLPLSVLGRDSRCPHPCPDMWPYAIRLNVSRLALLFLLSVGFYVLYSISSPAQLKRIPVPVQDESGILVDQVVDSDTDPFQVNLKQLLVACIQAAESGGHEVYRIRTSDIGELEARSKGQTREGAKEMVTKGDMASHTVMVHGLAATFPGLQIISEENHTEDQEEEIELVKPFRSRTDPLVLPEELQDLPHDMLVPMKQVTVWIDPLDATQEYTELGHDDLLKYVTTMVCVALNGIPVIGVIHKPFEHQTFWSWKGFGMSSSLRSLVNDRPAIASNRSHQVVIVSRSHAGQVDTIIHSHFPEVDIVHAGGAGYKILQVIEGTADAYVHNTLIKKWDICAPNALIDAVDGKFSALDGYSISYSADAGDVRNEAGVLAAMSYSQHHQFFAKLRRPPHQS